MGSIPSTMQSRTCIHTPPASYLIITYSLFFLTDLLRAFTQYIASNEPFMSTDHADYYPIVSLKPSNRCNTTLQPNSRPALRSFISALSQTRSNRQIFNTFETSSRQSNVRNTPAVLSLSRSLVFFSSKDLGRVSSSHPPSRSLKRLIVPLVPSPFLQVTFLPISPPAMLLKAVLLALAAASSVCSAPVPSPHDVSSEEVSLDFV